MFDGCSLTPAARTCHSVDRSEPSCVGSGRIRIRPGSTTEKYPSQSERSAKIWEIEVPTAIGEGIGKRNNTIPQWAGRGEAPSKLTEIFVESQQNALLGYCTLEDSSVRNAWTVSSNPGYIVPGCA